MDSEKKSHFELCFVVREGLKVNVLEALAELQGSIHQSIGVGEEEEELGRDTHNKQAEASPKLQELFEDVLQYRDKNTTEEASFEDKEGFAAE